MFKTPIVCDRRIYDKKGHRYNQILDIEEPFFYFFKEPITLSESYVDGREEMKETCTITVFGEKPFAKGDIVILEDGTQFMVMSYTLNYAEVNIMVKDMLKPRVESIDLVLE